MNKFSSIFGQILKLFPRTEFERLARETGAERGAKGFTCWSQFVAMLFCQIGQAHSLREICGGLSSSFGKIAHIGLAAAPRRSTLSYANEHRPWQLYRHVFYQILGKCRSLSKGHKFRFKNRLYSMDATFLELCVSLFDWATYRQTKGAVKLHLLLDHDGYLPVFAHVTEGNVHEINIARRMVFPKGSIVAMDKGYVDYSLFWRWTKQGVYFVTRLKGNADFKVIEERAVPANRNIFRDQVIRFDGLTARENCPCELRRVEVWDAEHERLIVLLTNHLAFGPTTVAAIYKNRWQIEIFFKALKQNLRIKTFVGTSKNALLIQIWTALIAVLVLKYLKFRSTFNWSLSNLVAMLRYNLFAYRDLWAWLDNPYSPPPAPDEMNQLSLGWT
ncbi:MAG: IS4 family transposase [Deltaproteobacteria bacterium]|nr:IS4 family transposase [Deltaproteobacteria bacterium]